MPRFTVLRFATALLVGFVAGFITIAVGSYISGLIYPMPEDISPKLMDEFIATLPVSAFLLMLIVHASGPFIAGIVCSLIAGRFWLLGQIGLGIVFLAGGTINVALIAHPWWFTVADLILYLPASLAGAAIGSRLVRPRP